MTHEYMGEDQVNILNQHGPGSVQTVHKLTWQTDVGILDKMLNRSTEEI